MTGLCRRYKAIIWLAQTSAIIKRQRRKEENMEKTLKIIGVIPARYKSSRFPGKPLVDICGKPMIWWVYQQAMKVHEFDKVYVATDDERIKAACDEHNMNVIMTSDRHQTGSDRVAEVASKVEGDLFINIQGDEPVINPEMIQEVISIFFEDETVTFGSLKKEITDPEEIRAASTVKVVTDQKGDAMYFSRSVIPSNIKDGQMARVFRHVGIYAYKGIFRSLFKDDTDRAGTRRGHRASPGDGTGLQNEAEGDETLFYRRRPA